MCGTDDSGYVWVLEVQRPDGVIAKYHGSRVLLQADEVRRVAALFEKSGAKPLRLRVRGKWLNLPDALDAL